MATFKFFMDKKGDQLTEKQIEGIKKFVRWAWENN